MARTRQSPKSEEQPAERKRIRSRREQSQALGVERTFDVAEDVGSQIGTGAIAAVAVAVLEKELLPAVLIGVAATLLPKVVPGIGAAMRPVVKSVVRVGYGAMVMAQSAVAEAGEQVQDIIAEVKAEKEARRQRRPVDVSAERQEREAAAA